jgi:hypothetical protein
MKAGTRRLAFVCLVAIALAGCQNRSPLMTGAAHSEADAAPGPGSALIVFMRPSNYGAAAQSSVFDITSGEPVLVGIVSADTKVAYETGPGNHRFMVVAESADFMEAEVDAGKTYYTIVDPRLGVFLARFSLRPVQRQEIDTARFKAWYADCVWVKTTQAAQDWAGQSMPRIRQLQSDYLPDWESRSSRPRLYPTDGI